MVKLVLTVALFAGLVMAAVGGWFAELTVTLTTADVTDALSLSKATAVSAWLPGDAPFQV